MEPLLKKKKLLFIQLNELNLELVQKYSNNINFKFFNKNFFKIDGYQL